MKLYKRILSTRLVQRVIAAAGSAVLKFVHRTIRWERQGDEIIDRLNAEGRPMIVCFWHGRLMVIGPIWRHVRPSSVVISRHRDGRLVARLFRHFGFRAIHGSTGKRGGEAIRAMMRAIRAREIIGVTPDGPRGPRMRASPGLIAVARMGGASIVPVSASIDRRHVLRSWDRFIVPLPFARGVFMVGEPIEVPRSADTDAMEAIRVLVEERITALTDEADRRLGMPTIEPGPPLHPPTEPADGTAARAAETSPP